MLEQLSQQKNSTLTNFGNVKEFTSLKIHQIYM
jgi:hypothetical protein